MWSVAAALPRYIILRLPLFLSSILGFIHQFTRIATIVILVIQYDTWLYSRLDTSGPRLHDLLSRSVIYLITPLFPTPPAHLRIPYLLPHLHLPRPLHRFLNLSVPAMQCASLVTHLLRGILSPPLRVSLIQAPHQIPVILEICKQAWILLLQRCNRGIDDSGREQQPFVAMHLHMSRVHCTEGYLGG